MDEKSPENLNEVRTQTSKHFLLKKEPLSLNENRFFAAGGYVTTATLNQSAMTKCHPEMERAA